jgi:chorismate-pyruvate lyase
MGLVEIFYPPGSSLGDFSLVGKTGEVPEPQLSLLNHHSHMTVTVEAFHGSPVQVQVLRSRFFGDGGNQERWYAREILLRRESDGRVVQYGIVRLDTTQLAADVWQEIRGEQTPLGRVLIQHDVLREVERCRLWKVVAKEPLAASLNVPVQSVVYGRTARIFCNGQPAIELLEIVP